MLKERGESDMREQRGKRRLVEEGIDEEEEEAGGLACEERISKEDWVEDGK